jgi:hypothetical protein
MDHLIEEISQKLKNKKILTQVTVGAMQSHNIESGGDFYRFIGEFSNGKANGLCKFFNEVNFIIEAYIYINGKKILTINYESSSIINWSAGENENTKKKPRVTISDDNLSEPKFRKLVAEIDLSDIENS